MTNITPATTDPDPLTSAAAQPLGPITEPERIVTLDVLRGFALFGIFMVNMQFFALPFVEFIVPGVFDDGPTSERLAWGFVKAFFEYKFISLFSLLFGVGLVVQMTRAEARGRSFAPVYLRRLVVLAVIGLIHGLLLWYGDILFLYACLGAVLLACRTVKAKTLLILSAAIVAAVVLLQVSLIAVAIAFASAGAGFGTGGDATAPPVASADASDAEAEATAADDDNALIAADEGDAGAETPAWSKEHPRLAEWFPSLAMVLDEGFSVETLVAAETAAYKSGPFSNALGVRAITYLLCVSMAVGGYGWRVLSMFFLGAGLMKLNFFSASRRGWHRRLCVFGLAIGLPLEIAFASLAYFGTVDENFGMVMIGTLLHEPGSYALCLGLVGAMTLLVSSGALGWLTGAMACVGRLALSNYLLQTVASTALMYWWGLRWFDDVTRVQQIGLVVLIYAGQLLGSVIYLRLFTIGPVEWIWRTLTYMRPQPILRR